MRYFMRNHAGQFAFVACGRNRARVDEQKSAGQGEGVDLARRDDSKLIGESFAGGFRRQLCAELFDVTIDLPVIEHRRLGQNLLGRLAADLNILLRAEKIEAGFETWLRMRTRRRLHSALLPAAIQLPDEQRNRQKRHCRSASDHIPGLLDCGLPQVLTTETQKKRERGTREKVTRRPCNLSVPSPPILCVCGASVAKFAISPLLFNKLQRNRINAVAQAGRRRPVIEYVTKMRATSAAHHLGATH